MGRGSANGFWGGVVRTDDNVLRVYGLWEVSFPPLFLLASGCRICDGFADGVVAVCRRWKFS